MDTKKIDARGQSCPIPVVLAKRAIEKNPTKLEIIVDNIAAKENVTRFASTMGYSVKSEENDNDEILLKIEK